jgi:NB-ARC domain.
LLTTRRKSQLAIEYSYQVRSKSPATWVFWVHASNEARFEQSFRDIADQVKIYGRQDPKVNIFKLVENRLRDEKLGEWVCILDNVDDDKFLCSLPTADKRVPTIGPTNDLTKKPLLEYIPRSQNGSIIITSRSREVALEMVDHEDLIKVEPMEKSESLELLRRKLNQPEESQECLQLVNALEFMPLAIIQAASYIRNRAPRYSVSQYLADFEGNDHKATRLLEKEAGRLSRDWEAKNSILVTWQISFDYLRQTNPSAAELLSFMSFFVPARDTRKPYSASAWG